MGNVQTMAWLVIALLVIVVLLSLPRLEMQNEFVLKQAEFVVYEPGRAQLETRVVNRGGLLPGVDIITPESCITADVYGEFNCTHQRQGKNVPCTTPVCGPSRARELGPKDDMTLIFPKPYPRNITFSIHMQSTFTVVPLASITTNYTCVINDEDYRSYIC